MTPSRASSRSASWARHPWFLYVAPSFPPQNLKELIAYGKTNPVPFGSAGIASMTHLLAETLKADHDIKLMHHVVYRGGTPALNDVLAGTIPMTFGTVTQALPQWQGGAGALGFPPTSSIGRCPACRRSASRASTWW